MEKEFGKFRSQSALKNAWISKKRREAKVKALIEYEEEIEHEDRIEHENESDTRTSTKMHISFLLNNL
jgi:hypothetical protein